MYVLGPLQKTSSGKQFVLGMKECYMKLTGAKQTSVALIASMIMYHWIILYGTTDHVLMETGTLIISKLF